MIRAYLRLVRRRPYVALAIAFGIPAVTIAAGPLLLGERGRFLVELWLMSGASIVALVFLVLMGRPILFGAGLRPAWRLALLPLVVLPVALLLIAAPRALGYAVDIVAPFDRVPVTIVGWELTGTRIAVERIHTSDGGSFDCPVLAPHPPGLSAGSHVLLVTHFSRLVLEVLPPDSGS